MHGIRRWAWGGVALWIGACPSPEQETAEQATAEQVIPSADPSPHTAAASAESETVAGRGAQGPGPGVSPVVVAEHRAERAAKGFGRELKTRLQAVIADRGPAAAVEVCSAEARAMAQAWEAEGGLRLGRASLRLRNPENTAPEWVMTWLREQGERPAAGVEGIATVDGKARFLAPIAVEPVCLTCHGGAGEIPGPVEAALRERYPSDRATGYRVGDLRGALWAEAEI